MSDVPILVGTTGDLRGRRFEVSEASGLTMGRADENDVVLRSDGVSRYHARFQYDNGTLWLRDNGSRNGVFVNDVRVVGHKALKAGDVVSVGGNCMRVSWAGEVDATESSDTPTQIPADDALDDTTSEVKLPKKRRWFWPFS